MNELDILKKLYLSTEQSIINELAKLRARGLIDYHAASALGRVQEILTRMQGKASGYTKQIVEKYFYSKHPERYNRAPKSAAEHLSGYIKAEALTTTEQDIIQRLETSVDYRLAQASLNIQENLTGVLLGREAQDLFRQKGLEMVMKQQAKGSALNVKKDFVEELQRQGVTAYTDKSGRKWSLFSYADMVTRTTARQAEVLSVVARDPEHDLYQITSHNTTCKLCAPYEGRVYSRSGTSEYYPPLSEAFGKIDKNGPESLSNSWMNIHPNCLHSIRPFTEVGKSPEELKKIRAFSSPVTNPFNRDPRSQQQINNYNTKERSREKFLADFRQWEKYRAAGIGPAAFQTFIKHKLADSQKYKEWVAAYKKLGTA